MKLRTIGLAGIAVTMFAVPVLAHHSFAMFDAEKNVSLQGTIKEFQWTNPHAWILVNVDKQGTAEQWAIEMNGPSGLARDGWRPKNLTPGMPVTLMIHPLRDGSNGGQFLTVTLPDGKVLGRGAGGPGPAPTPPAPAN
jgi:Family of unknown function (DUF6152)